MVFSVNCPHPLCVLERETCMFHPGMVKGSSKCQVPDAVLLPIGKECEKERRLSSSVFHVGIFLVGWLV